MVVILSAANVLNTATLRYPAALSMTSWTPLEARLP
jgi:hypothetical protein